MRAARTTTHAAVVLTLLATAASIGPVAVSARAIDRTPQSEVPLFDGAMRLGDALKRVSADEFGHRNERVTTTDILELAADPTVWVDREGDIFFADTIGTEDAHSTHASHHHTVDDTEVGATGIGDTTPYPLSDTFLLESRPGADTTIYLDFDGGTVVDTNWNDLWFSPEAIVAAPADFDGTPGVFSAFDLAHIQAVWQTVAEDYAPFDVNVTTKDPGRARIERTNLADLQYGVWVLVAPKPAVADCGCSGIAYLNSFDAVDPTMQAKPAWVFSDYPEYAAGIASHEVGHTFGLQHDGTTTDEYYNGQGSWVPIMGTGAGEPLSQWSKGEYSNANRTQDDIAVIAAHGAPLVPDDHGNTAGTATSLGATPLSTTGLIGTAADVDVFAFDWGGGTFTATASPATTLPNLDIRLSLRNAAGTSTLSTVDPASSTTGTAWTDAAGLGATVSTSLAAGSYTLWVEGVGAGDALVTGYTDYGSLGRYRLASSGRSLTVNRLGPGTGTVTSSSGGLNCGATCTANYGSTVVVTLTATPAAGSAFAGWAGACYGHDTCRITVDAAKSVTAVFDSAQTLSLSVTAPSVVPEWDAYVTWPAMQEICFYGTPCSWAVPTGRSIVLDADVSSLPFTGWSGACSGQRTSCTVSMTQARSVIANFATSGRFLTVDGDQSGTVTVMPYGEECYFTGCTYSFVNNSDVTLTAEPYFYDYAFSHWTGACTGVEPTCSLRMSVDRTVAPVFVPGSILSVATDSVDNGSGTITSTPGGIDCGDTCYRAFVTGSTVTLTASPAPGSTFAGWTGDCSGMGPCTISMDDSKSAVATFVGNANQLTVSTAGAGSGTVTSSPGGIDCGSTCSAAFAENTIVTLTATPATGSTFTTWSGACSGPGGCSVTMSAAKSVTATFATITHHLTVTRAGTGTGTVTSSPAGIDCGSTCSVPYAYNTVVTLTPAPGTNSEFTGWSGACSGLGACTVTMSTARSVTATFAVVPDTFRPFAAPIRLVDTRPGLTGILEPPLESTPIAANTTRRYAVGSALSVPAGAAVALNVVAVLPSANGNLSVYPCTSTSTPPPTATFLNYKAGVTTSTAGLVELGATGDVCVRTPVRTDVVIDASGWFPSGGTFSGLAQPTRLFDSRAGQLGALEPSDVTAAFSSGTVRRFAPMAAAGIPSSDVSALYVTAVAILPATSATLQVYPCSSTADAPPGTATVSYARGTTVATATVVELSANGGFCVRSTGSTHLLVDAVGWFGTTGGHRTFDPPSMPRRLLDTRPGLRGVFEGDADTTAPIGTTTTVVQVAGRGGLPVAASLGAMSLTITAQAPAARGWIKVWACTDASTAPPDATTINMAALVATGNQVFVATSTNGRICLSASSTAHATIDAHAWFVR